MKELKAALFDLDGVVFDTEPQYTVFWGSQCRLYHPEHPGLEHEIKGSTLDQIYDKWWNGELVKERPVVTQRVTSSNLPKMESVYKARPDFKDLFDEILTSEDFAESKPSPDCYLRGAARFGAKPEECVVLEDSFNGLKSGRSAGMFVVGLTTTNKEEDIKLLSDVQMADYQNINYNKLKRLWQDI